MSDLFISDYLNKITFLEKQIGAYVGYKPMEPFWVPGKGFMDPVRLQGAAKKIADFLKLNQHTFLVTVIKQKPNMAGNIELKYSGNDVFVEISEDVQGFEDAVIATLSHELTHKYMQVNGIFSGTGIVQEYENEVLTDITTIFLGLGKFLLNGCNNEKTYQERRGIDKYEVTKTMKVGYLTQRQMAFIYRLICSMRGISKDEMLSNLNEEAKAAVLNCEHYAEEYFNLNFKNENYRKTIVDMTSNQLLQLQDKLGEAKKEVDFVELVVKQLRDEIEVIKEKSITLQSELASIIKSSSHDPCMKFLECIKIEEWKNLMISTVSEKHKEIKSLYKSIGRLRKAAKRKVETSDEKRGNRFKIIIAITTIGLAILLCLAVLYVIMRP